ncbi:unnamed protein product [Kuraishia capsulata CBS 1993]|uniref:Biogenesis of lysosome-related organelles complex 1 subunit KXD1 n=1 Tax=Kuraishia capsulata CBS 1993 TaxID=1382522 RepID=W6MSU8_9ASCO|nr:uncharacterized protein KUCA_T00005426001 [Kuraishia capsulata CBS 1993]CDK29438.1 unnamed protein product [Kuraishia capsulata CBS 1993]
MSTPMPNHSRSTSIDAASFIVQPEEGQEDDSFTSTASDTESYAGSINHNEQNTQNTSFHPVEYLLGSLESALSSIDLDRSIVLQSQISGELNNTSKELLKMMEVLEQRIRSHMANFDRLKNNTIPELAANISKAEKKATKLTKVLKDQYPIEYSKSLDKVLNRITKDDENLYV